MAALLLAVPGSYLANEFQEWIRPDGLPMAWRWVWIVVSFLGFYGGAQLGSSAASQILRFKTRGFRKDVAEPRPVLIWLLSTLRENKKEQHAESQDEGLPKHIEFTWDLEMDLKRLAEAKRVSTVRGERVVFWSWEQTLRGICHGRNNGGPLKRLVLVCSRESVQQVHRFAGILRRYEALRDLRVEVVIPDGHGVRVVPAPEVPFDAHLGWNYEDFDAMWRAMNLLLEHLAVEEGIPDKDIAIDLTGGPKPATVVAASVTINRDLRNQYVCTNPKDPGAEKWEYEVLDYDLILGSTRSVA
jgi:hypothetical protein